MYAVESENQGQVGGEGAATTEQQVAGFAIRFDSVTSAVRSRSRPNQRASRDIARCNGRDYLDALLRPYPGDRGKLWIAQI